MKEIKIIGIAAAALLSISPIIVSSSVSAANVNSPVITYNGKHYNTNQTLTSNDINASFMHVPLNGHVDINEIKNAFGNDVEINTEDFDSRIASTSPVLVTATNPSTGDKTILTLEISVGDTSNLQTVTGQPDDVAEVYEIGSDNSVTNTGIGIQMGRPVSVHGTISIDGTEYTRINSDSSNYYILSKWLNGSYTNETNVEPTTKTIMHKSILYDRNGISTGKTYGAFRNVSILPDAITIGSKQYYRIYHTNYYVNVSNIDGTKRTLKKNAYVYATRTKRANNKVLKKGSSVTTYGSSYKFKNGKRYFRIGKGKQYVRTANF